MDCLGPNGKAEKYETFDVENMITPEQSSTATTQRSAPTASKTGRRCSLPLLLSLITLLISLLALVLSIYASVIARKGSSSTGSSTAAFLATSPRGLPAGYQAAHLFQGTGYFARLQPMLYPRSDHRVGGQLHAGVHAGSAADNSLAGSLHSGQQDMRAELKADAYTSSTCMLQGWAVCCVTCSLHRSAECLRSGIPAAAAIAGAQQCLRQPTCHAVLGCTVSHNNNHSMQYCPVGGRVYLLGALAAHLRNVCDSCITALFDMPCAGLPHRQRRVPAGRAHQRTGGGGI